MPVSMADNAITSCFHLQEYKSSGKDEKAFAEYLQQSVACVIASVVKNVDLASLEQHVQSLNKWVVLTSRLPSITG